MDISCFGNSKIFLSFTQAHAVCLWELNKLLDKQHVHASVKLRYTSYQWEEFTLFILFGNRNIPLPWTNIQFVSGWNTSNISFCQNNYPFLMVIILYTGTSCKVVTVSKKSCILLQHINRNNKWHNYRCTWRREYSLGKNTPSLMSALRTVMGWVESANQYATMEYH